MDGLRIVRGGGLALNLGLLAAAVVGATTFVLAGSAVAQREADSTGTLLEATHLPPLLTIPGEKVELSYDTYCFDSGIEETGTACDVTGSVFIRAGERGAFRELSLLRARSADDGRLFVGVPESISSSRSGFTYYAVLDARHGEATVTLPAAG